MSKLQMYHPNSAMKRITLPRSIEDKDVVDIATQHHQHVHSPRVYFYKKQVNPLRGRTKSRSMSGS